MATKQNINLRPATAKQVAFIKKLLEERTGILEAEAVRAGINNMARNGGVSTKDASAFIDALLAIPRPKKVQAEGKKVNLENLTEGFYLLDGEVVRVQVNKNNGHRSAMRLNKTVGKFQYAKGLVWKIDPNEALTLEEAKAYGHLHGHCAYCGTKLGDPKSVEAGVGPWCAKKYGVKKKATAAPEEPEPCPDCGSTGPCHHDEVPHPEWTEAPPEEV